jgi:predicted nucleic acid-binding protein
MIGSPPDVRSLVDTNIVVYAYDPTDASKHQVAADLLAGLSNAGLLVYSAQVFNEFCSVMMRPNRASRLLPERVVEIVRGLAATGDVVPITGAMTLSALESMTRHGLSFWDALIWAAAHENGVPIIYSEDFQHGREIEGVRFINPFAAGP